jgi:peptidoglycan/LPS O-acetylase OafA/YrhL
VQRIPSLDGLRALAILLVCLSHLSYLKDHPVHGLASFGLLGVRIFFVISGMLITRLLLQERETMGSISLSGFYIRRMVRIFPAMWFYVGVMAVLSGAGVIVLYRPDTVHALAYVMNYFPGRSWYLGHLWSLSVEEQFYLLWPFVLFFGSTRSATRVCLFAIAFAPALRLFVLLVSPGTPYFEWFPACCDSIATGCLLSLLPRGKPRQLLKAAIAWRWFFVVPLCVLAINVTRYFIENHLNANPMNRILFMVLDTGGVLLMNAGIALTLQRVVSFPGDIFGKLLNAPPAAWLGRISYSLYLWQMPFLNHEASSWVTRTTVNLLAALGAGCFSYYLIETPLLRLRKHMGWGEKRAGEKAPSRWRDVSTSETVG